MNFKKSLIVLSALSLLSGNVAYAKKTDKAVLRETGFTFSDCVVGKHYAKASEYILSNIDNATAVKRYRMLIDSSCMGKAIAKTDIGGMRFSGDTFGYGIAEALVRKDFAATGPLSFADRAPLLHRTPAPLDEAQLAKLKPKKRDAAKESFQKERTLSLISRFGECATRVAPEAVRKLAKTEVNSSEEEALLRELAPSFGVCLPGGVQLRFNPMQLRGTLMMNYYRLAAAPIIQADKPKDEGA